MKPNKALGRWRPPSHWWKFAGAGWLGGIGVGMIAYDTLFPPKSDATAWTFEMSAAQGWVLCYSCPNPGTPYDYGPCFSTTRFNSATCPPPAECPDANHPGGGMACPGTWVPGDALPVVAGTGRTHNVIQVHDWREVGGTQRVVIRQYWLNPSWRTLNGPLTPEITYAPARPAPMMVPAPWVNPWVGPLPLTAMPLPTPIPYHVLPYVPQPDPLVLPGPPDPGFKDPPFTEQPGYVSPYFPWIPEPWPGVIPPETDQDIPRPGYAVPAPTLWLELGLDMELKYGFDPDGTHYNLRPEPKTREKKMRVTGAMAALWAAVGQVTEAADLVWITYQSISCTDKYNGGMMGRYINAADKVKFIAENFDKVNVREFARNKLKNDVEDWFYGLTSEEAAVAQGSYRAGINSPGGKSTGGGSAIRNREYEMKEKLGVSQDNPLLDAAFKYIDDMFGGPPPQEFRCCAGKKVRCGRPPRRKQKE